MRGDEFLDKMGLVDPAYVEAADRVPVRKKRKRINCASVTDRMSVCKGSSRAKWAAVAACLCLAIAAVPFLINVTENLRDETDDAGISEEAGPTYFVAGDRRYVISAYLSVTDELPDGFEEAGAVDLSGGFEHCPYYVNPDIPEWIYVYHEVRTDGTVDGTGTLKDTPPHDAYVRYVDERLRGRDLICYEGTYYTSLWNATSYGDEPDVTQEEFDTIDRLYGPRIEGNVPEGFVLAGTAEFSGYETVPVGRLASNKEAAKVYYNPDDPDVIFVETHWFTAPEQEGGGEVRHEGFDVYMRYDCPFRGRNRRNP